MKTLFRSRNNRVISGVFGGIGEIYAIDPTLLRLAYVALTIFTVGLPGVIFYAIAAAIIPEKPADPQVLPPQEPPV